MPFPFPEDVGLGAGPPHAPVPSFSLPLSHLWRGFGKAAEPVWAVRACPAQPPSLGLVTDYFGQQVEEARTGSDWAHTSSYPAGWFQEAVPAFHLGQEHWSRAEKRRQLGLGLREQIAKGVSTCATPRQDYVHLSQYETRCGGSEAGATAPGLGI